MRDPILKLLGFTQDGELSDIQFEALSANLTMFAKAGGIVEWGLWKKLKPVTKAALVDAFEKRNAENAAAIGMASQGPRQAARIMATSDGGDLDARICLDRFMDTIDQRQQAKRRIS